MENKEYKILHTNNRNNKSNKGNINFISIAMLVIIISSAMVLFCEKFVFAEKTKLKVDTVYNNNNKEKPNTNNDKNINNINNDKIMKVVVRQYGAFASEKNAKEFITTSKLNGKYIVKQMDLYKVMGEIYLEGNYDLIMEKHKKIDSTKTEVILDKNSKTSQYSCEIISGILQVLNKFDTADVEFVDSLSLKTWTKKLVKETELKSDDKLGQLMKLKKYVDNIPQKIKQENLDLLYQSLYDIIANS